MINAGQLTQRIELLEPVVSQDNLGAPDIVYRCAGITFAHVPMQRGSEVVASERNTERHQVVFVLRYRKDVQSDWRLAWQGDIYEISAVERHRHHNMIRIAALLTKGLRTERLAP